MKTKVSWILGLTVLLGATVNLNSSVSAAELSTPDEKLSESKSYWTEFNPFLEDNLFGIDLIQPLAASNTPTAHVDAKVNNTKIGNIVINAKVNTVYDSVTNGQIIDSITNISGYTMDSGNYFSITKTDKPTVINKQTWDVKITGSYKVSNSPSALQVFTLRYTTEKGGKISVKQQ